MEELVYWFDTEDYNGSDSDVDSLEIDYPEEERYDNRTNVMSYFHGHTDDINFDYDIITGYKLQERHNNISKKFTTTTLAQKTGNCPVCLEPCREKENISYCHAQCGNIFHTSCIETYKQHEKQKHKKLRCPMCRIEGDFYSEKIW